MRSRSRTYFDTERRRKPFPLKQANEPAIRAAVWAVCERLTTFPPDTPTRTQIIASPRAPYGAGVVVAPTVSLVELASTCQVRIAVDKRTFRRYA